MERGWAASRAGPGGQDVTVLVWCVLRDYGRARLSSEKKKQPVGDTGSGLALTEEACRVGRRGPTTIYIYDLWFVHKTLTTRDPNGKRATTLAGSKMPMPPPCLQYRGRRVYPSGKRRVYPSGKTKVTAPSSYLDM